MRLADVTATTVCRIVTLAEVDTVDDAVAVAENTVACPVAAGPALVVLLMALPPPPVASKAVNCAAAKVDEADSQTVELAPLVETQAMRQRVILAGIGIVTRSAGTLSPVCLMTIPLAKTVIGPGMAPMAVDPVVDSAVGASELLARVTAIGGDT